MADGTSSPNIEAAETPEQAASETTDKPSMSVKVYAPFQVYFEGNAYSVSAVNDTGPFDILPRHHNFLCMLVPCNLIVRPVEGQAKTIKIHRALMHVKADSVVVFMDV
jgi:F0F1-type ATP synthase epsilon subunit